MRRAVLLAVGPGLRRAALVTRGVVKLLRVPLARAVVIDVRAQLDARAGARFVRLARPDVIAAAREQQQR
jgi:hypothetical protein